MNERSSLPLVNVALLAGGTFAIVAAVALAMPDPTDPFATWTLSVPGLLLLTASAICELVMLHRAWRCVLRLGPTHGVKSAVSSAGMAVGFMLIPVFNLYWVFIAYGKLSTSLEQLAHRVGVKSPPLKTLGYTIAVLTLVNVIPFVGTALFAIAALVLIPLFFWRTTRTVERIHEAVHATPVPPPAPVMATSS